MKRHALTLLVAAGIAAVAVAVAAASAVPVGKLPPATKIAYKVTPDKSVTLTLPRPAIKGGVWRVARAYDSKVVYQQGEQTHTARDGPGDDARRLRPDEGRDREGLRRTDLRDHGRRQAAAGDALNPAALG
jgi:hypothetical protein